MEEIQLYQERILSEGVHTAFPKYAQERSDWYVDRTTRVGVPIAPVTDVCLYLFLYPSVHLIKKEEIWAISSRE